MKFIRSEIVLEPKEPLYITPYSDVHFNDANCALSAWQRHYHQRAQLQNSYFINIGDFNGLILPNDLKRYKPSVSTIMGADDILNKEIKTTVDLILSEPKAKWLFWGTGNHEDEIEKRHYFNLPQAIAEKLQIPTGLYCGLLFISLKEKTRKSKTARQFILAYHHGAWGGAIIKGLGGATRFFNSIYPWYIAVFGHNHTAIHDVQPITIVSDRGYQRTINRHIVNTGGWLLQAKDSTEAISYTERKGYPLAPIICPLIKIWFERVGKDSIIELFWEVTY